MTKAPDSPVSPFAASSRPRSAWKAKLLVLGSVATVCGLLWARMPWRSTPASATAVFATATCGPGAAPARAEAGFAHGAFTGALSQAKVLSAARGEMHVAFDVTARVPTQATPRAPVQLALVVDHSGSMAGGKLEAAKRAAGLILDRLRDDDQVALVQYDNLADLVAPMAKLGNGNRARLHALLSMFVPAGGTNLHAGLELGLGELRGTGGGLTRLVLLSDGQANQGITDPQALGRIAAAAANRGLRVTTIGVGVDYNENLMELLAESGRGHYYYAKDESSLESVFTAELSTLERTVATSTMLRISPCAGVAIEEVYGYDVRREGSTVVVPMPDLFGGDSRRVVARLRTQIDVTGPAALLQGQLSFVDALTGHAGHAALALGADVTADDSAAEASADPRTISAVLQMQGATTMRAAAAAYEKGDTASARQLLQNKEAHLRAVAKKYRLPENDLAVQALAELPKFAAEVSQQAPESTAGKGLLKGRKAAARSQLKSAW